MDNPQIDHLGNKRWRVGDELHRTDGPAIEYADSSKNWYLNGELHRTDGPACEWSDGDTEWWVHGRCHRTDGPAIEYANGSKFWYFDNQPYSFDEWLEVNSDLTHEQKVIMKLQYG
jgi:hypothetical protein